MVTICLIYFRLFERYSVNHTPLFINLYCEFKNCPLVLLIYLYHFIVTSHKYCKACFLILSMIISCVFVLISVQNAV